MTKSAAKILEEFGHGEIKVDPTYSGRFMYGETTYAIIIPAMSTFYSALGSVMEDGEREERNIIAEYLEEGINHDQFGRGFVIY